MLADADAQLLAELAGEPAPVKPHGKPGRKPTSPNVEQHRRWEAQRKINNATPGKPRQGPATNPAVDARDTHRDVFLRGKWQELLLAVTHGELPKDAMANRGIAPRYVQNIISSVPEAKKAWDAAQQARWRVRWPMDLIEEIMVDIAAGEIIKDAVAKRGMPTHEFYHLALKDPEIKQMYDDAQQIRLESMAEQIIAVSDDAEKDFNDYGRLNAENINRARLKVDTRKWIMSRIGWKRFGDRLQTEQNVNLVVDHASRLDAARKRVEGLRTIEAVVEPAIGSGVETTDCGGNATDCGVDATVVAVQ